VFSGPCSNAELPLISLTHLIFRNRFVVPGGKFSVAHETCRAAPAIAVIIILAADALLVANASAGAMPEHIWPSTIPLWDAPMH
jgi:hypothetical protein